MQSTIDELVASANATVNGEVQDLTVLQPWLASRTVTGISAEFTGSAGITWNSESSLRIHDLSAQSRAGAPRHKHGLSNIPAVPADVRARVRAQAQGVAPEELFARLRARDPETAARLRPSDPQRILRALEIFEAFGMPLAHFQGAREGALLDAAQCQCLFLAPEREKLHARSTRVSTR